LITPYPPEPNEYEAIARPDPLKAPLFERYAGLMELPLGWEELLELIKSINV
jgi:hypothetical protein